MDNIDTTEPVAKTGLSRRQVIVGGAVGAAAVWTVPLIDSVPAGATPTAGSNISSACSYFELVYTTSKGTFADRVSSDGSCGGNTGSNDVSWCWSCDVTHAYDNQGTNSAIRLNGTQLGSSGCTAGDGTFTVSGNTITPGPGVTILFAMAHAGSLNSGTGQEPHVFSGGVCTSGSQDKVNVACPPISSASFSCLPPGVA